MAKRKRGIVATERDKRLFLYLFVNKAATVRDITQDIFKGVCTKTVNRRLVRLSCAGLVEASAHRDLDNRMVYSLTKKGLHRYVAERNVAKRAQLKSDSVEHDLTILEIKRKFRTFKNVLGIYSENLVRSGLVDDHAKEFRHFRELRPDAVVKVKIRDKVYLLPLEYEASSKSPKRNAKLLGKYYSCPVVAGVFFIARTDKIARKVRQKDAAKKSGRGGLFYYCLLEDVLAAEGKMVFTSITGGTVTVE